MPDEEPGATTKAAASPSTTMLRVADMPYVESITVGDVTVTTEPTEVEDAQAIHDYAAQVGVRVEEVT